MHIDHQARNIPGNFGLHDNRAETITYRGMVGWVKEMFKNIIKIYQLCDQADANFFAVMVRHIIIRMRFGKKMLLHAKVIIKGVRNITSNAVLQVGLGNARFVHDADVTYLNIQGQLFFKGNHTIGRGCRFDVAKGATVTFGHGGYINAMSIFIINHALVVGDGCVISWSCQFLDEDFHEISYEEKKMQRNGIRIGNHVWLGSDVKIYKGTVIPDGCVIAAGSIVRGVFLEENTIIAGNPARIIRTGVSWR